MGQSCRCADRALINASFVSDPKPKMSKTPQSLEDLVSSLEAIDDRSMRIDLLISLSDGYRTLAAERPALPMTEQFKVPACESEAYAWAEDRDDGTLRFHFAVENPQGISAMVLAAILGKTLSGQPLDQVAAVPRDVVYRIFGNELSMGKSMGLMGMVSMVQMYAKQRLETPLDQPKQ